MQAEKRPRVRFQVFLLKIGGIGLTAKSSPFSLPR